MEEYPRVTLNASDKISLVSNLSTMLTAGIPILEAVDSLLEDTKGNHRKILEVLRADLIQGKRVFSSLAKFPQVFDKVTVNVVKASEEAGTLDTTLKDLRDNIRKETEFNDKVKSALVYPLFILTVFFGVVFFILIFVIPRISDVFLRLNLELPLPTRILIFLSDLILKHTLVVGASAIFLLGLLYFLFRQKKNFFLEILYSLPFVNQLITMIDLARFARSLHLLLYSGLPITSALDLAGDVVMRKKTAQIIAYSKESVLAGKRMSEGLRAAKGYIPPIMIKIIEAGEKTGTLDKSMQDISDYFDYQVTNVLKTLTSLLEPLMLVFVGIVVGGMMLAIIAPIYGLISQVGKR